MTFLRAGLIFLKKKTAGKKSRILHAKTQQTGTKSSRVYLINHAQIAPKYPIFALSALKKALLVILHPIVLQVSNKLLKTLQRIRLKTLKSQGLWERFKQKTKNLKPLKLNKYLEIWK